MSFRDRVKQRVEALKESPITLAKSVGLERGFINDIIIGRKGSIRGSKLELVAKALQCDPAFLIDGSVIPRVAIPPPSGLRVAGVCEAGVWRERGCRLDHPETVAVCHDPRFPAEKQVAYLVRGEACGPLGDDWTAVAIDNGGRALVDVDDGSFVVVRRSRGDLTETSVRRFEKDDRSARLTPLDPNRGAPVLSLGGTAAQETIFVVAVIAAAVKMLF